MKVTFEPFGLVSEVARGSTLLEAASAVGLEIESVCGGKGTCAKCKIIVLGGLSRVNGLELKGLTEAELQAGYRLACQARVEADVEVAVPEESRISRVSILSEGVEGQVQLEPWVHRHTLRVPQATIEDQVPDLMSLERVWPERSQAELRPTLRALRQLPFALRKRDGHVTLIAVDDRVVRVDPGDGPERILGIAFDIGTTTVVGYLMDLETGEQLAVSSRLNPQARHGDDVVSRIGFATDDAAGLQTLRGEIVETLNGIIHETRAMASVVAEDLFAAAVVGNTTMLHLFLGISPAALALSPYVPVTAGAMRLTAEELGIEIWPDGRVCVLPNIAGWVGADTVGVILATGLHKHEEIALAVDIGTNGEMALGSRRRLVACSTAAGPAFEGAHLSCGMRAADGAIDSVGIDGDVWWRTIGDKSPRGICGSGLVDTVAGMLRAGVIDSTGMMQDAETLRVDGQKRLARRIRQAGRGREFELVGASESGGDAPSE